MTTRTTTPEAHVETVELSAGPIDYVDSGGDGPVIVLLGGLLMDASLWDAVIAGIGPRYRCIAPTLPLGAHRRPMREDADLSPRALARLAGELIERLDLEDVTLVGNDTGGALVQLLAVERPARVTRLVLVSCDAFDNFPPGLTGRTIVLLGRLPQALFGFALQQMRLRPARRLPMSFGWLTRRGDDAIERFLRPVLARPDIRRDAVQVLRGIHRERGALLEIEERLELLEWPTLVVWASEDRVMPPDHGRWLAKMMPNARLVMIDDTYTLIPLDQPAQLARAIAEFVGE